MASSPNSSAVLASLLDARSSTRTITVSRFPRHQVPSPEGGRNVAVLWRWMRKTKSSSFVVSSKKQQENALQYRKLGDSDLVISEITLGTMTYGQQNTEKEAHEQLSYAFERGINALDTAEMYPVPPREETQGRTDLYISSWLKTQPRDKVILATKVSGYSERSPYLRDSGKVLRVDAANIRESVEKSLKRLNTDYIDLLQIHWKILGNIRSKSILKKYKEKGIYDSTHALTEPDIPLIINYLIYSSYSRPDRYAPLFGEYLYDPSKWRESVPFAEQLRGFQELIDQGKVRYIGVSNETSYGVMEFVHAAKVEGLPKIVSIQNNYSMLVRCKFELDLVEVCHPNNHNIGLLAYSPLAGGSLTGKYLDINSEAAKRGRFNLFPGYMERYNKSLSKEATDKYLEVAKKHGLHLVELALAFVRDRSFVTSSIIGATSVDQLREDIDAILTTERPLPPEVLQDIESVFKKFKDPAIN